MVAFISKAFGYNSWETLVAQRWLRNKANLKEYRFDPNKSQIIAVMYDGPNAGDKKAKGVALGSISIKDRMRAGVIRMDEKEAEEETLIQARKR